MTKKEFKKLNKIISLFEDKLESTAIEKGIDITSSKFQQNLDDFKSKILSKSGYTLDDYNYFDNQGDKDESDNLLVPKKDVEDIIGLFIDKITGDVDNKLNDMYKDNDNEFIDLRDRIIKLENRKPDVLNKIVKETIIEKPIITVIEKEKLVQPKADNNKDKELNNVVLGLRDVEGRVNILEKATTDVSGRLGVIDTVSERMDLLSKDFTWFSNKFKRHTLPGSEWNSAITDQRYYTKGQIDNMGFSTDEKVKYDSADPTAGYLGAKVVAGSGITISEGTGGDENKVKITNSGVITESDPVYSSWYNSGSPTLADLFITNELDIGNGAFVVESDGKIDSNTGTIDFKDNNITTTGNVTGIIKYHIQIPVTNPTGADSFLTIKIPRTATITSIRVLPIGGTSITCRLRQTNATGGSPADIFASATFSSGSESTPTITGGSITAGNRILYVSSAIVGTVVQLLFDIEYTMSSN